ncbi:MAG: cytochrome c [Bauldia sp.]|nr:cytochrome c [Bauldia sp.]
MRKTSAGGSLRRLLRIEPLEILALALLGALFTTTVWSQPVEPRPLSFTAGQAARGEQAFLTSCSGCHGVDLRGGNGPFAPPALIDGALDGWLARPPVDLFRYIATQMPAMRPASLAPETYAAILAYLMSRNGFAPGAETLPALAADLAGLRFAR